MKKIIYIFFLFIICNGYSQVYITELVISPTDDDEIANVKLTVVHNNGLFYETEMHSIQNNIITLKTCYFGNIAPSVTYITTEREIQLPYIPDNYTLVAEIYFDMSTYPPPCDFLIEDMTDSASLSFSAPLEDDVVLTLNSFQTPVTGFFIHPNPVSGVFQIEGLTGALKKASLYSTGGKLLQVFDQAMIEANKFEMSPMANGFYFLVMEVGSQKITAKLLVQN